MSDELNLSIRRWRNALAGQESIDPSRLDELQDHLEAELTQPAIAGLNDDEKVLIAARRIGQSHELDEQFLSVDPTVRWRRRSFWLVLGLLGYPAAELGIGAAANATGYAATLLGLGPWLTLTLIISLVAVGWGAVLLGLLRGARWDAPQRWAQAVRPRFKARRVAGVLMSALAGMGVVLMTVQTYWNQDVLLYYALMWTMSDLLPWPWLTEVTLHWFLTLALVTGAWWCFRGPEGRSRRLWMRVMASLAVAVAVVMVVGTVLLLGDVSSSLMFNEFYGNPSEAQSRYDHQQVYFLWYSVWRVLLPSALVLTLWWLARDRRAMRPGLETA